MSSSASSRRRSNPLLCSTCFECASLSCSTCFSCLSAVSPIKRSRQRMVSSTAACCSLCSSFSALRHRVSSSSLPSTTRWVVSTAMSMSPRSSAASATSCSIRPTRSSTSAPRRSFLLRASASASVSSPCLCTDSAANCSKRSRRAARLPPPGPRTGPPSAQGQGPVPPASAVELTGTSRVGKLSSGTSDPRPCGNLAANLFWLLDAVAPPIAPTRGEPVHVGADAHPMWSASTSNGDNCAGVASVGGPQPEAGSSRRPPAEAANASPAPMS
mmetsp:Transcript_82515/g.228907  ORF Transcript_82515/g.228907 Transcript_82515/m.228907 type:complete len:272 (+) Transcript_82515:1346-2161(+)